jgi:hypothetical protein
MSKNKTEVAKTAFGFVLIIGIVNLFADISGSLASSSGWNRRFSRSSTVPRRIFLAISSTT